MFLISIFNVCRLIIILLVVVLFAHYFLPQSWGFYTSEPNVPLYNVYKIQKGYIDKTPFLKNNLVYGMGISLEGRILFSELYRAINTPKLSWKSFPEDSIDYITRREKFIFIAKEPGHVILQGKFLITKTSRSFYLTVNNNERVHFVKQYILADIR